MFVLFDAAMSAWKKKKKMDKSFLMAIETIIILFMVFIFFDIVIALGNANQFGYYGSGFKFVVLFIIYMIFRREIKPKLEGVKE